MTKDASSPSAATQHGHARKAGLPAKRSKLALDRAIWHRAKVDGDETDEAMRKKLIEDHHRWTGSQRACDPLDNWAEQRGKFVKVFLNEYRRAHWRVECGKWRLRQTIAQATKRRLRPAKV